MIVKNAAGGLPSLHTLSSIDCRVFGHGHSDQCDVKIAVAWICISLMFSDADIFSCDFLKGYELNLHLEIGFFQNWPAFFGILFR